MRLSSGGSEQRGAGVLDIILALGVFSFALAAVIPTVQSSYRVYRLASSASQLADQLEAARMQAIARNSVFTVQFDQTGRTVRIVDTADTTHPTYASKTLETDVWFANVPQTPITFSSRGAARGGTVYLATYGHNGMAVVVESSGKTEVRELSSSELAEIFGAQTE